MPKSPSPNDRNEDSKARGSKHRSDSSDSANQEREADGGESTFEESLQSLERIVRELEQGNLPLEESIAYYADAAKHLKHCYSKLANAERKVQMLRGVDASGEAETADLDDSASSLEERQSSRSQRRTARFD